MGTLTYLTVGNIPAKDPVLDLTPDLVISKHTVGTNKFEVEKTFGIDVESTDRE